LNTATYKITAKKQNGSYKLPKTSRYGSDQRERVYDPELFGLKELAKKVCRTRKNQTAAISNAKCMEEKFIDPIYS